MPEYMDLYNSNYEKIGKLHQRGTQPENGTYYLVVNVWIMNSANEILLAQRHHNRKFWGGLWECAASGAVLAGESSLQGALRETKEEIGIELVSEEALLLETLFREYDIRDTYLFKKDINICDLTLQSKEVIAAKWVTRQEYESMGNQGLLAPPVQNFYELLREL